MIWSTEIAVKLGVFKQFPRDGIVQQSNVFVIYYFNTIPYLKRNLLEQEEESRLQMEIALLMEKLEQVSAPALGAMSR